LNGITGAVTGGATYLVLFGKKRPLIPSPKVCVATSMVIAWATDQSRSIF